MDYAHRVAIVACPFCRDLFEEGEASRCALCGVALVPFEKLPSSSEATEDGVPLAPEHEALPFGYLGRGRGALGILGVVGLFLFFCTWIHVTLPDDVDLSGFALARRLGWAWGAGVGWMVLVPTVWSRRTVMQMRGARVAAAFLSAVPAVTIAVLLARPPYSTIVPLRFAYAWALWASLAASLVATAIAFRFGGRVDDLRVARGSSAGQAVH